MEYDVRREALELKPEFKKVFKREPEIYVAAPARVNLIGEHTDYNEGFVLPAAINMHVIILSAAREDNVINLRSHNFDDFKSFFFHLIGKRFKIITAPEWINCI